ncbi:MAG: globin-coupled sensor protein [Hyphomicrobium sp.]|uniref:methyl-accepting chemotaxis protein n=1 Tax=Hyphomicrobium sp. TaxID=82 RepID=UPI0039E6AB69
MAQNIHGNATDNFDSALTERLNFIQLDEKRCESIRKIKSIIDRELPIALDQFYETIRKTPETLKFFRGETHMAAAKSAQINHWTSISTAKFDARYVSNVKRVGQTHARIGLEPRWYIGGYALVIEHLVRAIVTQMWPSGRLSLSRNRPTADEVGLCIGALAKAMMLDMDFSISVYAEAAEEARRKFEEDAENERIRTEAARREAERKAEEEAIGRERAMVSSSIGAAVGKLAAKDLVFRLTDDLPDAYGKLQKEFNEALEQLDGTLQQVITTAQKMTMGTREIAAAADDLSRRTEQQAASVEETAAALEEITQTVKKSSEGAVHARNTVADAKNAAESSREVVRQAVEAMTNIERSSSQIGQIIGVIDEIAFQTNLLALNAGVEAARAGDAGRGFAVVASEVRALAQRSAEAAKEIKTLISTSTAQVEQGARYVAESGKTLEQIIAHVVGINQLITEIASAAEEQAGGLQEINTAINDMDKTTQQNASMVEQTTAACHSLTAETIQLSELVGQFKVNDTFSAAALRQASIEMSTARHGQRPGAKILRVDPKKASSARGTGAHKAKEDWEEF